MLHIDLPAEGVESFSNHFGHTEHILDPIMQNRFFRLLAFFVFKLPLLLILIYNFHFFPSLVPIHIVNLSTETLTPLSNNAAKCIFQSHVFLRQEFD